MPDKTPFQTKLQRGFLIAAMCFAVLWACCELFPNL